MAQEILIFQEWLDVNKTVGHMPAFPVNVFSSGTVAGIGPVITSIRSITATSVQLTWKPIDDSYLHGTLQGYKINFRLSNSSIWSSTNCSSGCLSTVVDHLEAMKSYKFRMQVINEKGNGISGPAVLITMPRLVPNMSPGQVVAAVLSSTTITVEWDHFPLDSIPGAFLGYRVLCIDEKTKEMLEFTTFSWIDWILIENLKKFTWYLIRVFGFSDQGLGASSIDVQVRTLEDVPSAPPSDAIIYDMRDISTIDIQWSPIPQEHRNGILLGYKLTCIQMIEGDDHNKQAFTKTYNLLPTITNFTVRNLNSSTSYLFELLAYTSIGDGVATKVKGGTCNCERDIYTNWLHYPPYVSNGNTGTLGGIFGPLIKDMIITVCGTCPNGHGRSEIHLFTNGKGNPAKKVTHYDVINDIDDVTDVSFPIRGYMDDTKFSKYYSYVSVVEYPGTAFLAVRKDESASRDNAVYNTLRDCWTVVVVSVTFALLTGMIIWFMDCGSNPEQFSPKFHQGAWEGLWFCYISMTTVGYGDRSPVSKMARITTVIWILIGLVITSICTGAITSSSTVVVTTLEKPVILYGTKISAVENSTEYRIGLLKNAKMVPYPSVVSSYQALSTGEVQGVLVDAYVAGSMKEVTPLNTYVNRIIKGRSYSYGIVLSGKAVRLQQACSKYIQKNKALITNLIKQNINPIENLPTPDESATLPATDEQSIHQTKPKVNIWDVIFYCLVTLGVCIFCGFIWQAWHKSKIQQGEKLQNNIKKSKAEVQEVIQQLYDNCNQTFNGLKQKHVKQLNLLSFKLKNGKL